MISYASVVPAQRTGGHGAAEVEAVSAIERYRELVALAGESVERMRAADRARVRQLLERLAESQDRMAEVIDQEKLVRQVVAEHWEAVVGLLWDERWFTMTTVPAPDESVPPRDQREYNTALDLAFRALEESLQKRALFRKGA
ncbi:MULTISPECIES: hypothetical protein [Saccharothrix]|uniref:hypothetical protein n=1 Tax=Saccharothrix TaxID=2071 RepID=UPI00093B5ADF|nr:hypothetical protein [Saccharothrix sp. CB00851]OKI36226.1 hypothetical protein A6A25_22840 [Saccharothrix sp. CB00851]